MDETILTGALNPQIGLILLAVLLFGAVIWALDRVIGTRLRLSQRQAFYGWVFLLIPALYFLAVMIYPMLQAFQFSVQDYNILRPEKPFVGLDNYESLFGDNVFWKALGNSFRFALFRVPLVMALSLITALMFQTVRRFKNTLRVFMLLPFMTSMVALGWIFNFLYSRQGPVFNFLRTLGVGDTDALLMLNVDTALPAIAFVSAWASIGYYTLLFTVGLDAIPEEIYDASKVDGANAWNAFWRITLPLLNPTLVLVSILAVTASLKNFDLVRVMSGNNGTGGPVNSTLTMPLFIYMEAFNRLNMGRAAAITVIFFLIILVITLVQLRLTQRNVEY